MLTLREQFLVHYLELTMLLLIVVGYRIGSFKIATFSLGPVEGRQHRARCSSRETIRSLGIGVALLVVLTATDAQALTLFRYKDRAQLHCPADTVGLDFKKRKYYFSGQKLYGSGLHGSFVCLKEARRDLYRRSLFGLR
jgi:hypothetical protein